MKKKTIVVLLILMTITSLLSCNGSVDEKLFISSETRSVSFLYETGEVIYTFYENGKLYIDLIEEGETGISQIDGYSPTLCGMEGHKFYKDENCTQSIVSFEDLSSCGTIWDLYEEGRYQTDKYTRI